MLSSDNEQDGQTGERSANYPESIGTSQLEYDNSSFDSSSGYEDEDDGDFDSFFGAFENGLPDDQKGPAFVQQLSPGNHRAAQANCTQASGIPSNDRRNYAGEEFAFVESVNPAPSSNHLIRKELTRDELLFKRQQNIEELLKTEIDYVNDLKIVIDVYRDQILRSPYLSRQIAETIFLNWNSLLECNQLFLNDLVRRKLEYPNGQQIERIGDVLKFHFQDQMCEKYTR